MRKNLKLLLARFNGLDVHVDRDNVRKKKKERKAIWKYHKYVDKTYGEKVQTKTIHTVTYFKFKK